ncbi:hypothetical protein ACTRXD_15610 [Nitrospira sp. T9]
MQQAKEISEDQRKINQTIMQKEFVRRSLKIKEDFVRKLNMVLQDFPEPKYEKFREMIDGLLNGIRKPGIGEFGHVNKHSDQKPAYYTPDGRTRLSESEHQMSKQILEAITFDPVQKQSDYSQQKYENDVTVFWERESALYKTEKKRGGTNADKSRGKELWKKLKELQQQQQTGAEEEESLSYRDDIRNPSLEIFKEAAAKTKSSVTDEARNRQILEQESNLFGLFKGREAGDRLKQSDYEIADLEFKESGPRKSGSSLKSAHGLWESGLSSVRLKELESFQQELRKTSEGDLKKGLVSIVKASQRTLRNLIDAEVKRTSNVGSKNLLQQTRKTLLTKLSSEKNLEQYLERNLGVGLSHLKTLEQKLIQERRKEKTFQGEKDNLPPGLHLGQRTALQSKLKDQMQKVQEIKSVHKVVSQMFSAHIKQEMMHARNQVYKEISSNPRARESLDAAQIGKVRREKEAQAFQERMIEMDLYTEKMTERLLEEQLS